MSELIYFVSSLCSCLFKDSCLLIDKIMKTHKDLDVWKKSIALVTLIYEITKDFPQTEIYGLTNQIRRCAVSIPSNIAEGSGRQSDKEFVQFLHIGLGSLSELETQLIIATNIGFLKESTQSDLLMNIEEIRKMLIGLIKFVKNRIS